MSGDVYRCMVVLAADADLCRALAAGLAPRSGAGMWTQGLSVTGAMPATHYIAAGFIGPAFGQMLGDPAALHMACVQAGVSLTAEQAAALLSRCDISTDSPDQVKDRLGLRVTSEGEGE